MKAPLGYCTNVHAGADLAQTRANLEQHAVAVKERFSPDAPMGVGLWLSAPAARKLLEDARTSEFADWLRDAGLTPYTFNGFPYGDFHQRVVKHNVYLPTWHDLERLEYTLDLIRVLDALLEPGVAGSISTLPIAWGDPGPSDEELQRAAYQLRLAAEDLERLQEESGRSATLCIEPEPGCFIQRGEDMVRFFEDYLLTGGNEDVVRRRLGVCHDVCHAAVMFEEQADVLRRYQAAGITVGKIQVSSAVRLRLDELEPGQQAEALDQLRGFDEQRYLHQTCVRENGQVRFYEDLSEALAVADDSTRPGGEWRVHFHVPIHLERFGLLETSRAEILECLAWFASQETQPHWEVETYAWGVLPAELQQPELADGIAQELAWLRDARSP